MQKAAPKNNALKTVKEAFCKPLQNKAPRRDSPYTIVNITYIIGSYRKAWLEGIIKDRRL